MSEGRDVAGTGVPTSDAAGAVFAGVVLAAGAGTRLRPLTDQLPKALCPVGGTPLVDLALARLSALAGPGPGHLAVNAHHRAEAVRSHVGGRATVSVESPVALGTAGALRALRGWIDGRPVVVTNADSYLPGGLTGFTDGWDGERSRLLCRPVAAGRRPDFTGPDGEGLGYVGACLLTWKAVRGLPDGPCGLYEVLWREAAAAGALDLVTPPGPDSVALDCGTPADYLAANMHASGGRNVVAADAVVEGTLVRSVVWPGAWVGPGEHLTDAVRAGSRRHPVTVLGS